MVRFLEALLDVRPIGTSILIQSNLQKIASKLPFNI